MTQINIPDKRSPNADDYDRLDRRGQMKRSWPIGVGMQSGQIVTLEEGLTWGSIGRILAYLLGDVDESAQDELWETMFAMYKNSARGRSLH